MPGKKEKPKELLRKVHKKRHYILAREKLNWVIYEECKIKDKNSANYGELAEYNVSYFGLANLDMALKNMADRIASDCENIPEYISNLRKFYQDLKDLVDPAF